MSGFIDATSLFVAAAAGVVLVHNMLYLSHSVIARRPAFHLGVALLCAYLVTLYLLAVFGPDNYLIRSGLLSKLGTLIALVIVEYVTIMDERERRR